jgi:hypothetical protein
MTRPFPIIGLCGLAGSGKSTLARHLADAHGYVIIPFARPLKAMARAFGLTHREMAGDLKESPCPALCGKTPRQFMQWLGTEFGRQMIGQEIWVEAWKRAVEDAHNDAVADLCDARARALIVADDVRFDNEARVARDLGGIIIRIERPGAGSASGAGHASEGFAGVPDAIIRNTGDEPGLLARFDATLAAMLERREVRDQSWADAAIADARARP